MWLTIRSGKDLGKTFEIGENPITIGRDDSADLVLADSRVSRRHAEITPGEDGKATIKDLGSGNGTLVNGKRVESQLLSGAEQIQLGDTVLATGLEAPREAVDATVLGDSPRTQSAIQRIVMQRSVRRATVLSGAAIFVAIIVGVLFAAGVLGGGSDSSNAAEKVVAAAAPATVMIEGTRAGQGPVSGSGWVLDAAKGLIVTNAHVINDAESFQAGANGHVVPAQVVADAPCEDLAVLKVSDTKGLKTMPLGRQSTLRLGEGVVTLGYPQTASQKADLTSTTGVVSVARSVYREPALDIPLYPNVVQTDAAINPGNSGGPLLDLKGRLVGVNSAGRTISPGGRIVQGQNYAIGVDRVKQVVRTLRTGRSLGWIGAGFDYPAPGTSGIASNGLLVGRAVQGSVAARTSGLVGSLITAINGTPVSNSLSSYCDAIDGIKSGSTIDLKVVDPSTAVGRNIKLRLE
jgi:S1-C subfamily serine protease